MPDGDHTASDLSASLARKLNLLLDSALAEGRKITYNEVSDAMKEAGTPVSRARWHYMRVGSGPAVRDEHFLRNLAKFFGVNENYLLEDDQELPEKVEAQLDLLATMRANKIKDFAARQLDGLDPATLRQIRDLIDEHLGDGNK